MSTYSDRLHIPSGISMVPYYTTDTSKLANRDHLVYVENQGKLLISMLRTGWLVIQCEDEHIKKWSNVHLLAPWDKAREKSAAVEWYTPNDFSDSLLPSFVYKEFYFKGSRNRNSKQREHKKEDEMYSCTILWLMVCTWFWQWI